MPWFAALVPAITAIGTAASAAEGLYGIIRQSEGTGGTLQSGPQPATSTAQDAQKAAIINQAPNIQSQLGGSVSPDYYANQAATDTGNPGNADIAKQVLQQFLGLGGTPSNQGTTPAGSVGSNTQPSFTNFLQPQGSDFNQPGFLEGLVNQQQGNPGAGVSGGFGS